MGWKEEVFNLISGESSEEINPLAARELIIQNLPRHIYKYRSVTEYSKQNLDTFTVWMESPGSVNDPFDSAHTLDPKETISLLVKNSFSSEERYKQIPGLVNEEMIRKVNESDDPISVIIEKVVRDQGVGSDEQKKRFIDAFLGAIRTELDRFIKWSNDALRDGSKLCSFSHNEVTTPIVDA